MHDGDYHRVLRPSNGPGNHESTGKTSWIRVPDLWQPMPHRSQARQEYRGYNGSDVCQGLLYSVGIGGR